MSEKTVSTTRLEIWFSGRVQGVGFRATVNQLARRFAVTGRVCNMSDGRVELLAEGEQSELVAFRAAVLETLDRYITGYKENWAESKQSWQDFAIAGDKYAPTR